ncbi:MBOAT family O-acyltransferase [Bacteroidota bacterium]
MVFSSSLFLLYFFPVFIILYFITPVKYKNYFALFASVLFYSWGGPRFIFIVAASIIADFYIIRTMSMTQEGKRKNLFLALSVILNVGLLLYFKYANFFVDNINSALTGMGFSNLSWTRVALPIGISFFTFQKLSYSVDVYRKVHKSLSKISDYALYIILFPQLIAGPIVRFHEIADQLVDRSKQYTIDNKLIGFYRFVIGLSKKVLIANVLGAEVDRIFALGGAELNTPLAWFGVIAYSFQIYYDFSGYSDMAIGIGRMMGFVFPENFNNPYISWNITEFWRRWHITLGRWMRDYLYIPLGGSKVSTKRRLFFNLWVVFLISGLWHGAAWNFVIWGGFHGLFLVLDKIFLIKFTKKIGQIPSIFLTYLITLIGWVLFRASSIDHAFVYIKKMFSTDIRDKGLELTPDIWIILIIAFFFAFFAAISGVEKWQNKMLNEKYKLKPAILMTMAAIIFFALCVASITSSGFNPFIYFRF